MRELTHGMQEEGMDMANLLMGSNMDCNLGKVVEKTLILIFKFNV